MAIGLGPVSGDASPAQSGTSRGRVLVVTPWFPYPQDNGSRQRLWALLGELHSRYDVDLVGLVDEELDEVAIAGARQRCEHVEVVRRRRFEPRSLRALAAFVHRHPRAVVATYTPELRAVIDRLVERHDYDAVIASQIHVARYVMHLTDHVRVLDDLEVAAIRDARPSARKLEQQRQWLTWVKQRQYARYVAEAFDHCVVVSETERDALRVLAPNATISVVPNGVDLDRNAMANGTAEAGTIVHAGALGFWANREGVEWFTREVMPAVRAQHSDARLLVTGRTGNPATALPTGPGVEYTGYLDDVRPTIARARVSVVPLQRGGGTRLKILESLALGTPVVTTPKGVEGLDLVPDREVLVARTPAEFAASVLMVLDDDVKRASLRDAGRRAVEERYGWGPITASFGALVAAAVDARPRRRLSSVAA